MILASFGRALGRALALALFAATAPLAASAHSLPGSLLTLSQSGARLQITLNIALDDLAFVLPEIAPLQVAPLGPVPQAHLAQMQGYFAQHIALEGSVSPLTLTQARLGRGANDHVGSFAELEIGFEAQVPEGNAPVSLRYDAVMHEIRSHRAAIFWQSDSGAPQGIADFGYNFKTGTAQPVPLTRP